MNQLQGRGCGSVTIGDEVIDYGDLCVDIGDVIGILEHGDIDLAEALRQFINTKSFNADLCELCGDYNQRITCTENLAIYCSDEDKIYYNIDRVAEWLTKLYITNMGTLMKQLASELKDVLIKNSNFKLGVPLGLVMRIAAEATVDVAMTYLLSHERYHWAHGPGEFPPEEEVMAAAYGMYTAYTESLNPLVKFISMISKSLPEGHAHLRFRAFSLPGTTRYLLSTLLKGYFKHLTLARLAYDNALLKDYSGFTKYLDPIPSEPRLVILSNGIITVPIIGRSYEIIANFAMNDDQYVQIIHDDRRILDVEMSIKSVEPKFTGEPRIRRGEVREEYKHCEVCIDLKPSQWLIPIESIINYNYLKISQVTPEVLKAIVNGD